MTDARIAALEARVNAQQRLLDAMTPSLTGMGPQIVDVVRNEHASHRLLFALASIVVQTAADPMKTMDAVRTIAFGGLSDDQVKETRERLEKVLSALEQGAIAAVKSRK